ncbi:MAG: YraN family protein [Chloroflexi bacterium]|nr:YraN family protein [Chloroflexota bacterium]MCY3581565.1 YraN family protein [Chloroflexota bacterium]MCY3717671.1 YraN family protein [Chloroflexota bacterium]MDE2649748.1 YraN family protein [Chloroflexota bacterium]MXX49957.1 YraN family protein [Chloroflexota bacterium]
MRQTKEIGQRGERLARAYLRRQGYAILHSNWSCLDGELDIVARRAGSLVFVEVKTRRATNTEAALASINPKKRQRLLNAAYRYLHENGINPENPWRIDVIAIALAADGAATIAHVEDAFDW